MSEGASKRPRVRLALGQTEQRWVEVEEPQVGSQVIEALWALNTCLSDIQAKLVTSWEATSESVQLLH